MSSGEKNLRSPLLKYDREKQKVRLLAQCEEIDTDAKGYIPIMAFAKLLKGMHNLRVEITGPGSPRLEEQSVFKHGHSTTSSALSVFKAN